MYKSVRADRDTWSFPEKTVNSKTMILVGFKKSRRRLRKGKTEYYFNLEGTRGIYYNQARNGVWFSPMALREYNMKKYYDLYCVDPLTRKELEYLKLHPHIKLVK